MTHNELILAIRKFCTDNQNSENALKYKRYFKESPVFYGLTQPQMNLKAKQLLKEKTVSFEITLKAVPELLGSGKYEEITLALLLVNGFEKEYSRSLFTEISSWFSISIHNWAHADILGMFILPKFFKNNIIRDEDFESWFTSEYKFQRRCIPVALLKTLKSRNNFQSLFVFLEPLIVDTEREVHQGMGWFLRECWKLKPAETEDFLFKWKDRAPRLIIQYATEKMSSIEKLRFKRSK